MRNWLSRQAHNLKCVGSNPTSLPEQKRVFLLLNLRHLFAPKMTCKIKKNRPRSENSLLNILLYV